MPETDRLRGLIRDGSRVEEGASRDRQQSVGDTRDHVVAVAIGACGTPGGRRPLGATAAAVATTLLKPVVVVPPDAGPPEAFRRVLVPLEGSLSSSLALRSIVELARNASIDVVALHVHDEDSIPSFTDQPQRKQPVWAEEFLARYCPWGPGAVRLETRVGRSAALVPLVADQCGCDLIALGWSRELAPGRAPVVRGTLERTRLPVLLMPVRLTAREGPQCRGSDRGTRGQVVTVSTDSVIATS